MDAYFGMLLEGFLAGFRWLDQIKAGNISLTSICLLVLTISLFWRYVLQPLFGFGETASDTVKRRTKIKDGKRVNR